MGLKGLNGSYSASYKKRSDKRWMLSWKALRLFAQSKEKHWAILSPKAAYINVKLKRSSMERTSFVRFLVVSQEVGVRKAFDKLIPEELWDQGVQVNTVPDWMLLLCKLKSKISDNSWQMILSRTKLGKSGVSVATA